MHRRTAQLPLHGGKAPPWLFRRMSALAGEITLAIADQFGAEEMLRRLSDPWWFQAFGCVLGFDWHSSGVTTVTCGALKDAAQRIGPEFPLAVAGGKGATSRRTPQEIADYAARQGLATGDALAATSRLTAKIDSAAVQDGFQIYQHNFFITPAGQWCVIQQGMNDAAKSARRYHWLAEHVTDFVCEPHAALHDLSGSESAQRGQKIELNMVAREAAANRAASVELLSEPPSRILDEVRQATTGPTLFAPKHHRVLPADINRGRLERMVVELHERNLADYQSLLGTANVGPATIRALALVAEVIYDAPISRRDPAAAGNAALASPTNERRWADYSHAHGGKDGTPFPVDCRTYDTTIAALHDAVRAAKIGDGEKLQALKRLTENFPVEPNGLDAPPER